MQALVFFYVMISITEAAYKLHLTYHKLCPEYSFLQIEKMLSYSFAHQYCITILYTKQSYIQHMSTEMHALVSSRDDMDSHFATMK